MVLFNFSSHFKVDWVLPFGWKTRQVKVCHLVLPLGILVKGRHNISIFLNK